MNAPHPECVLESVKALAFVCPGCRGDLAVTDSAYRCSPCGRTYPVHAGIPDFRLFPDPYLDFAADHHRTELVLAELDKRDLVGLLEFYWSHSDITPPRLRAEFIRNAMRGEGRARRVLRLLADRPAGRGPGCRILEIGSGSGNFLVEAVRRHPLVVGADIGMRWLHITRRRFRDHGLPDPPLVCCCAEHLPFASGQFDLAVCCSTLEFTRDPERVLTEASRVLTPDGGLYLDTVNRYSIAKNPYAQLWGVGFLPRAWQPAYVRWRRRTKFEMVRMISLPELTRLARAAFGKVAVELPDVDDEVLRGLPWFSRLQVRTYRRLKSLPGFRHIFRWVGPQWDVLLTHPVDGGAGP